MLFEDFSDGAEQRWQYLSDQVMGGISDGGAVLGQEEDTRFALLAGNVSTANNGGFIQLRRELPAPFPTDATGLKITVRGANGPYFIHIRTRDTRRPWQYYQASFPTTQTWDDITLGWDDFAPKGQNLPGSLRPENIVSIGLVAYGRDHEAQLAVKTIVLTQD